MSGDRETRAGAPRREAGEATGAGETLGGWRSQGRGLKTLFFVSVAVAVLAVVRCSTEIGRAPVRLDSISVLRPSVDVPEGVLPASPDSIAVLAARQMARALSEVSGVEAAVVDSAPAAAGVLARFSLTSSMGNVMVGLELIDARSRVLSSARSEGPPEHLYTVVGLAARRAAADVWPPPTEADP